MMLFIGLIAGLIVGFILGVLLLAYEVLDTEGGKDVLKKIRDSV